MDDLKADIEDIKLAVDTLETTLISYALLLSIIGKGVATLLRASNPEEAAKVADAAHTLSPETIEQLAVEMRKRVDARMQQMDEQAARRMGETTLRVIADDPEGNKP